MLKGILAAVFFFITLVPAHAGHEAVRTVHCLDCHKSLPFKGRALVFYDDIYKKCLSCHRIYHGTESGFDHPSRKVPSMPVPADMPLDSKGRMTCITCHTFHSGYYGKANKPAGSYLRRQKGRTLCYSCHRNFSEVSGPTE